jgi:hypothetical protein
MDCIVNKVNLSKISFLVAATGNATTNGNFTTPTDRGDIYAMDFTVASNTIADVDGVTITANVNGLQTHQNVPAIDYSPLFNCKPAKASVPAPSGSTLGVSVVNDQANAILVYVNLYLVPTGTQLT